MTDALRTSYRPDIDGLRAVAVLPIVAFHAGTPWLGGGFVGVDVFFVISGFLIGSLVDKQCAAGTFSFRGFYARRVRRIAPALLATLGGTLALGVAYGLPAELAGLGRTTLAALASVSNIYFWRHSDYFDTPAQAQPLLHTWSLSIEEQFYLFLPVGMVLLYRWLPRRGARTALIGAGALLSFAASAALVDDYPTATFYLLPTRAWELLLGVLVGLWPVRALARPAVREAVAAAGAGMIAAALFLFTPKTVFPGPAALLPCLGAACIIAAGQAGPSVVGRALSTRPAVFVGLISYSLYLWHWPVIVFQTSDEFLVGRAHPALETLAVMAASFALAVVSWRFVEQPFRSRERVGSRALFGAVGGTAALAGAAGLAMVASGGFPSRFSPAAREIASFLDYDSRHQYRAGVCMISSNWSFADYQDDQCLTEAPGRKNYLLLGDSHAAHLWRGLVEALPAAHVMQATASGCRPTLEPAPGEWDQCRAVMDHALREFLPSHPVDALLLAAKWEADDLPGLGRTLDWARAHGTEVVLFGPIVQYEIPVPRLYAHAQGSGEDLLSSRRRLDVERLDEKLAALAAAKGVAYVSLWDVMCRHANCLAVTAEGRPLQFDYGHVTTEGSRVVAKLAVAGTVIDEGVR